MNQAFCKVRGGHGFYFVRLHSSLGSGEWRAQVVAQKRKDRIDKYYQAIEGIIGRLRENEECVDELEKELIRCARMR